MPAWVAYEPIEDFQGASFDRMMTIAAKAPLWIAQAAWPGMREAGYGRIVLNFFWEMASADAYRHGAAAAGERRAHYQHRF
jgi:NAD(P)-dependent dehydrogenase (short-subunit alcohol dehydrogenase family)